MEKSKVCWFPKMMVLKLLEGQMNLRRNEMMVSGCGNPTKIMCPVCGFLNLSWSLSFLSQLSAKPSLTADGQVSSPASVNSSADPSSQLALADGPAPSQEDIKMEVKKQEEDDEGADTQGEGKGKMGKGQPDVKTEEKPEVRLSTLT